MINWLKTRKRRKGQSIVEFALGGVLLMMLLAAAIDIGRAYYTYIVVQNMAGEGALFIAGLPDADCAAQGTCGSSPAVDASYQGRARNVAARVLGGIISKNNVNPLTDVTVDVAEQNRCPGVLFNVTVSYHMNDLFFPALLGFQRLTISAAASGAFMSPNGLQVCPTPTPLP